MKLKKEKENNNEEALIPISLRKKRNPRIAIKMTLFIFIDVHYLP